MMKAWMLRRFAIGIVVAVMTFPASAAIVSLTVEGTVFSIPAALSSEFSSGDRVRYEVVYNTNATDSNGSTNIGLYFDAVSSFSVTVGSSYSASSTDGNLETQNDVSVGDVFKADAFPSTGLIGDPVGGLALTRIAFQFFDTQALWLHR